MSNQTRCPVPQLENFFSTDHIKKRLLSVEVISESLMGFTRDWKAMSGLAKLDLARLVWHNISFWNDEV
jgi:hypothetical protein